jgi:hypothetical protein
MTEKEKTKKSKKKAKFHNPANILKKKIGSGGLSPKQLEKAETIIQENKTDFVPFAQKILVRLEKATTDARKHKPANKAAINGIALPIMEMKSSAGMFKYSLVSEIASVVLDFLESIDELNDDGFTIVDVHYQTLEAIIRLKLSGSGGKQGKVMADELYAACRRYERKYGAGTK